MSSPFKSILEDEPETKLISQEKEPVENTVADFLADLMRASATANSEGGSLGGSGPAKASSALLPLKPRPPLRGGVYPEADAVPLLNEYYFIGKNKQETAVFRINDDGSVAFVPSEQFKLEVQNIFVKRGSAKPAPAEKFWKESPYRHERELVFKPGGTTGPDEFNLYQGFNVEPQKGWQKQRRFLRHLHRVICRRDKQKFKYLMFLLAWFVQNPDKHAGVVLVLKSREQGTGKSTVGKVMLDIYGQHGFLVDDKDRLLGRFTDWLETACFVLAEEILFAGDLKSADKMKSMITGDTIQIERKYGSCRQVQNRMKVIATTNHDHAIAAGSRDRRHVVYDVSNECVGDKEWFDTLYRDLADGGTSEFLWLLQNLQLGDWHPRRTIKTEETTEQQRMSGDSVYQWSQACIIAEVIIGIHHSGFDVLSIELGEAIAFSKLLRAYSGFCKQQGLRTLTPEVFGKACADMFGPRKRLATNKPHPQEPSNGRPWGYHVPDATTWQKKLDARLGVHK